MKLKNLFLFLVLLNIPSLVYAQTWNKLGSGASNPPLRLKSVDGKLQMIGVRVFADDSVNGVGFFDGTNADSLRNVNGTVYDYAELNGKKYVGGQFNYVGDWPFGYWSTSKIAQWDSTNGWHTMTPTIGLDFAVYAMQVYNGELYVGGGFTNTQGVADTRRIAKWDGTAWSSVGGGFIGQARVNCMAIYHGELYVGGRLGLPNSNNNNYYNLVKWNGTQWDSVGGKFGSGEISSLCVDSVNDILYIGGGITYAGNVPVWSVAAWDGDSLYSPGGLGITCGALAMTMFEGKLWVGGASVCSDTTLAFFDGQSWSAIIPSPNSSVTSLADYQGNLYVGGDFTQVNGNLPANHIACYGNTCPTTVGVSEIKQAELKFNVYPNPAHTLLTVETDEPDVHLLILRNAVGQELYRGTFSSKTTIDLSAFAKGIILADVCNTDGTRCFSKKVVLE